MFDPVDVESTLKESKRQSKQLWLSSEGFVYPGFKSSFEANMHPRMPDEARLMELKEVTAPFSFTFLSHLQHAQIGVLSPQQFCERNLVHEMLLFPT